MKGAPIFGPWYANEQDDHWSVHASDDSAPIMGNRVCTFPLTEQGAARARLIAAAPDLATAASELLAVFDEQRSLTTAERIITGASEADLRKRGNEAIEALRAALTRATPPAKSEKIS